MRTFWRLSHRRDLAHKGRPRREPPVGLGWGQGARVLLRGPGGDTIVDYENEGLPLLSRTEVGADIRRRGKVPGRLEAIRRLNIGNDVADAQIYSSSGPILV